MHDATPGAQTGDRPRARGTPPTEPGWRGLTYRWFVEYNPMYLLSAALVLLGMILASRGIDEEWTLAGQVGVAAIAEVYALALIGGAALLTRIRLSRPAVMLGLLAVLYQGDLTLHTETSAFLSSFGAVSSAVWFAVFVGKLYALGWALKLRLSRSAFAVPVLGALVLAVVPHLLRDAAIGLRTPILTWSVFLVVCAALWTARGVRSPELSGPAGLRGRRAVKATWAIWAALIVVHALFWTSKFPGCEPGAWVPVASLLATRWIRRERGVWLVVGATLVITTWLALTAVPHVALMGAVVLVLHALRRPGVTTHAADSPAQDPYRSPATDDDPPTIEPETVFAVADRPVMARLLTGAMFAVYLSAWSCSWSRGGITSAGDHALVLDLLLTAGVVLIVWRARVWSAILPLAGVWLHHAVKAGLVSAPVTMLQWGASLVGGGFALLALSLAASLHFRRSGGSLADG